MEKAKLQKTATHLTDSTTNYKIKACYMFNSHLLRSITQSTHLHFISLQHFVQISDRNTTRATTKEPGISKQYRHNISNPHPATP